MSKIYEVRFADGRGASFFTVQDNAWSGVQHGAGKQGAVGTLTIANPDAVFTRGDAVRKIRDGDTVDLVVNYQHVAYVVAFEVPA